MNLFPIVSNYGDIFKLADFFQYSSQLFFAYSEGVFELLKTESTAQSVANQKKWVLWKTKIFLDGLVAMGLLEKKEDIYFNSVACNQALVKMSPMFIGDLIEHERLQWELWNNIGLIMATESPSYLQQESRFKAGTYALDVFQKAMQQLAGDLIPEIITMPCWKECNFVLDLAGGHGMYLIKLALVYPNIKGEIWDLKDAKELCEALINQHNLGERLCFKVKDISSEESFNQVRCDGVMLNHCLHHFSPSEVQGLFINVSKVLSNKGVISIVEAALDDNRISPAANALFSTYMMINRNNGQLHSTNWICNQLRKLDFQVKKYDLESLESDVRILAVRK